MAEYKDIYTLDGRLKHQQGVTKAKVAAVARLVDETLAGNRTSKGFLEESITTSDAIFNFAAMTNINVLGDYPEIERQWTQIVTGTRLVSDFRPATLYSINPEWAETSATLGPSVVSPRVPEAANYPYAYFEPEQASVGSGIVKRGFKTGFTFEAFINDSIGFLAALPEVMRKVALDTEEFVVFEALLNALTSANDLAGGTTPEGDVVPPNAPFSRAALIEAILEITNRTINGRKVVLTGGYKLLVPAGQAPFVQFALNPTLVGITDGSYLFNVNGYDPLSGVTVIESEHIPANTWVLIPNGNSAGRPIIEALRLAGHELPELRVQGNTGTYVGGGAVSPFEGSFENDSADFRIRQFLSAHVWTPELIIHSDGSGA